MPTTCDIDDPQALDDALGRDFTALLRDVAKEYASLKEENKRLLARLDRGYRRHSRGPRFETEFATSCTRTAFTELSDRTSSVGVSLTGVVVEETVPQDSEQRPSPDTTSSVWTVAPSQPMVALPGTVTGLHNPKLHYLWTQSKEALQGFGDSTTKSSLLKVGVGAGAQRGCSTLREDVCMQRFMIEPTDFKRMLWDAISILILSVDVVMVPLMAFDISETPLLKNLRLICTTFWTFDMLASFLTGFYIEGTVEMRPRKVFRNYLRGWFPFDFVVVLLDWLLLASTSGLADLVGLFRLSKILRFARILRAMRVLRLARVVKLPALLEEVADWMRFDSLSTAFRVMRSLVTIALANHFLACGWYAVGKASDPSWITVLDEEERDLAFRYATALHWSLTQFTPASMEIHPKGLIERIYSICVLFLALVVFSSFVSSITNAMNHLRQLNEASSKQKGNLRRYIQENHLSVDLGNRITAFAKQLHVRTKLRVHENEVEVFKVLPESLKLQLHWEVYVPILSRHSFFFYCAELFEPFVLEICRSAVRETSVMTGQELFSQDDEATGMYLSISGELGYYKGGNDIRTCVVKEDEWCCEVSLWLAWAHEGQLAALTHAELLALDARVFRKIVSQSMLLFEVCKAYALAFQEYVSHLSKEQSLDVLCDHDSTLEMAQLTLEPVREKRREVSKDAFGDKTSWRTWHTLELIHACTPPPPKVDMRSNTH